MPMAGHFIFFHFYVVSPKFRWKIVFKECVQFLNWESSHVARFEAIVYEIRLSGSLINKDCSININVCVSVLYGQHYEPNLLSREAETQAGGLAPRMVTLTPVCWLTHQNKPSWYAHKFPRKLCSKLWFPCLVWCCTVHHNSDWYPLKIDFLFEIPS